jgi:AraC-like DNA-binding protein
MDFLTIQPFPVSHLYWHRKEAFQLREDRYVHWVMFAVTDGRFRYRIGDSEGEAVRGDLVICPPHIPFFREVAEPVSFHFYNFRWMSFDGAEVDSARWLEAAELPRKVAVRDRVRLASTLDALSRMPDQISDEARMALLAHYFADLWKHGWLPEVHAADARIQSALVDPEAREAADWIREHAFGPLHLSRFAESKGWSPVQMTRKFHAAFGQTPSQYLTSLRLQKAKALLLESDMTLDDIAASCGYESGFYLSRLFNKKTNMSPSAYRKLHRL